MTTLYSNLSIEEPDKTTLVITGEIAWDKLEKYYTSTLERIARDIEIDGFRKGKAPLEAVETHVGDMKVMQEASQAALGDAYPAIVLEKELRVIGYPQISITKMAKGSALGFAITTAIMPELILPDYKKIAQQYKAEDSKIEVTEEELEKSIDHMRNMYAHSMAGPHTHEKGDPDTDHDLPVLDDEFVQKLGDFKTVEDFKKHMKNELEMQKANEAKAKRREAMILAIAKESKMEIPDVFIESEKDKMLGAMKDDIARMGLEYDKWLEHSAKTEEDIRKEMHIDAEDRARAELILKEIAKQEQLVPDPEKVQAQVEQIKQAHPDIPEENIRMYVENIYLNERVLEFLESQKG